MKTGDWLVGAPEFWRVLKEAEPDEGESVLLAESAWLFDITNVLFGVVLMLLLVKGELTDEEVEEACDKGRG